ncbi:MAG: hypothetical protein JSS27_05470 [Planctomycetes bacterium]|nr:hypothetical protein [Planctomycetota bacterium]
MAAKSGNGRPLTILSLSFALLHVVVSQGKHRARFTIRYSIGAIKTQKCRENTAGKAVATNATRFT